MNMHRNARLTPKKLELPVKHLARGEHAMDVACAMGGSVGTVNKRRQRYRRCGLTAIPEKFPIGYL